MKKTDPDELHTPKIAPANVFDEDDAGARQTTPKSARRSVVVEVEPVAEEVPEPQIESPKTVEKMETPPEEPETDKAAAVEPSDLPAPSLPQEMVPDTPTVEKKAPVEEEPAMPPPASEHANVVLPAEPALPSFFEHDLKDTSAVPAAPVVNQPVMETPAMDTQAQELESVVPQAFVGGVNEIASDVKKEKRSMVIVLIGIIGLFLIGGGAAAYWFFNKSSEPTTMTPSVLASPEPTTVAPTPEPVATASATPTASQAATLRKGTQVAVLNGTKISGLASKEAAVLKKAGYTLGTVGNGDPDDAGTIIVPAGQKATGTDVASLLTGFTFTITESKTAKLVTVTLGDPQ